MCKWLFFVLYRQKIIISHGLLLGHWFTIPSIFFKDAFDATCKTFVISVKVYMYICRYTLLILLLQKITTKLVIFRCLETEDCDEHRTLQFVTAILYIYLTFFPLFYLYFSVGNEVHVCFLVVHLFFSPPFFFVLIVKRLLICTICGFSVNYIPLLFDLHVFISRIHKNWVFC